ncbi:winged helix-turn-helix domain-containing protein [Oligoflexus tunisiensis]|uniref:winged helix-turn-helix domain-containing protein n=1 Tax=Oligoflexus tunisiensis TaxID=708132 RepID=UPI00114CF418|nr:winged helix-turn-helix domain-containing protein [Oligoflexus tunisiensis]
MSVIWILERPRPPAESTPALLQGDFAVRAFASLRNFLRLAPLRGRLPDLVIVRSADFADELINLENLLGIRYESVPRLYLGEVEGFAPAAAETTIIRDEDRPQLPFMVQEILNFDGPRGSSSVVQLHDLMLDTTGHRLKLLPEGDWVRLKPKEGQILRHLLKNPNHCLSHEDLVLAVWKDVRVSPRSMASHISRLRRYLQGSQLEIRNVYGGGYQLCNVSPESGD